jgi:hypothetical protein
VLLAIVFYIYSSTGATHLDLYPSSVLPEPELTLVCTRPHRSVGVDFDLSIYYITGAIRYTVLCTRGNSNRFFHCFFGNGSHFREQSQEDADTDVIGYKCRTRHVVVGAK